MRTSLFTIVSVAVFGLAGCTKSVEIPPLAGPSTFARSILLKAEKDVLIQNGQDSARIAVSVTGPTGQAESVNLRAQIVVDGIPQDFGTLSSKNFVSPATLVYTAPAASTVGAQLPQTVSIEVTPIDSGDFASEFTRTITLQLVPPGFINPINPNLVASFTVTPAAPQAFSTATFDASSTTNNGVPCGTNCSYAWNFGDGTSGASQVTTHVYRSQGSFTVTLIVTDSRGATAAAVRTIAVGQPTPPTPAFTFSPSPVGVGADVFFNAEASRAATGRTIARFDWEFGDGNSSSGVTTTHRYRAPGTYTVILKVTDDVGAVAQTQTTISVVTGNPVAVLTFLPSTPRVGQTVTFNASASSSSTSTIVSYTFNYGDGNEETVTNPVQSHVYLLPGTYAVTLTVTDAIGRKGVTQVSVTVAP
jgi:PKD repeat protein